MEKPNKSERIFKGIGVFPGVAIGKALLVERSGLEYTPRRVSHLLVEAEVARLRKAREEAREELSELKGQLLRRGLDKEVPFLEVHLQILNDDGLFEQMENVIREELVNAEWALDITLRKMAAAFESLKEDYIRERIHDIRQALHKVMQRLLGHSGPELREVREGVVVVAHDLSPADLVRLEGIGILGIAVDVGSPTSHLAIVSRSLGVPTVVAMRDLSSFLKGGETVIVDGQAGTVVVEPEQATLRVYESKRRKFLALVREFAKYAPLPSETLDGYPLPLRANIEFVHEARMAMELGAEGIGLFRTEYLFLGRREPPGEEEQFQAYRHVIREVAPYPATIRTFDLGGEKEPSCFRPLKERNPALGLKGIRLALREREAFKGQLKAILRASAFGKAKVLFPMVSSLEELREAKALLEEVRGELEREGLPYDGEVSLGVMVEVPSAALIADLLAKEVDFLSIGTNDLIQYTMAVDRQNEEVAYLYKPLHPAILRLIEGVVEKAHDVGKEVGICGEVASDPFYGLLFLGMGVDELSMVPSAIPRMKRLLRRVTYGLARDLLKEVTHALGRDEGALRRELSRSLPEVLAEPLV